MSNIFRVVAAFMPCIKYENTPFEEEEKNPIYAPAPVLIIAIGHGYHQLQACMNV